MSRLCCLHTKVSGQFEPLDTVTLTVDNPRTHHPVFRLTTERKHSGTDPVASTCATEIINERDAAADDFYFPALKQGNRSKRCMR
jgi:hypothetical protein